MIKLPIKKIRQNVCHKAFRKRSLAVCIFALLFTINLSAKSDDTPKLAVTDDANKIIKEQIKFPIVLNSIKAEKVNVLFTVNEIGNVNLLIVTAENIKLKTVIESQFAKLTLSKLKANNAYSVVFNFKTI